MARRSIPIEEKIETQKELVSKAKDRYETEVDKLEKLMRKNCNTIIDKFHVIKHANAAIDKVRKVESKTDESLKKTKY